MILYWNSLSYALGGCGSFYAITIASQAFKGLSTVKQHRLVTQVLKEEIEGIHGLQVRS
jgi:BolA-like protein 3